MMSRRVLLATGAVVAGAAAALGAAQITHTLDDAARFVGLEPKPEPDPADTTIVRKAASDQAALTALLDAAHATFATLGLAPVVAICFEQLKAVGGNTATIDIGAIPATQTATVALLATQLTTVAGAHADAAQAAFSPELVRVLASMSAGLTQCVRYVKELA